MTKFVALLLLGIMFFTPALVAAQTSGSGTGAASGSGSSTPSGSTGSTGSSSGSMPSGSSGSTSGSGVTSPSASPTPSSSPASGDFSQYTTKADCEKAGGMWQAASNKCAKK